MYQMSANPSRASGTQEVGLETTWATKLDYCAGQTMTAVELESMNFSKVAGLGRHREFGRIHRDDGDSR